MLDLLDMDGFGMGAPAPAPAAPAGLSLAPQPTVDSAVFQQKWGVLTPSAQFEVIG
jgi:hypothetical protein